MFGIERKRNRFGLYTTMFVLGAVAGAAVALLYAPMSGRKLQKQLRDVIDDKVDNVQSAVRKFAKV